MIIRKVNIQNLRNISTAELDFSPEINIITGDNGAGKTTLLEALYLLGRAKSFRQGNHRTLIKKDCDNLLLYAAIEDDKRATFNIGFSKRSHETLVKIDGVRATKLSELASSLPICLITPHSHRILEEGPEHRRKLLNWGVFHVEHDYRLKMSDFKRALLQRNTVLKSGSNDLSVWNKTFIEHAYLVSERQARYFEIWKNEILEISKQIEFLDGLDITLDSGWKSDQRLEDSIESRLRADRERGFTTVGPHRADLIFKIGGSHTKQTLSRGQQKILITIVLLAQARIQQSLRGKSPIFLIDDMESELDTSSMRIVTSLISQQSNQFFITSLMPKDIAEERWKKRVEVFHVEHGVFS